MLQQPGLEAEQCPNRDVCGTISQLSEEEAVELAIARREGVEMYLESVRVGQRESALMLLMQRGNPQSSGSLGINEMIETIDSSLDLLETQLEHINHTYIAPPECETHIYNVKRPYATYWYNKLTAQKPIFEPSIEPHKVKVIHLSHNNDARNVTAREGIERRNRLVAVNTKLKRAAREIQEAVELLSSL